MKTKRQILEKIDQERDKTIEFLSDFLKIPSPNPPGDTRAAAKYVADFLKDRGFEPVVSAGRPDMPNITASFQCGASGRHMTFNGHIDVFPVDKNDEWQHGGPWSGAVIDGKIYGRGACDMKAGLAASLFAFCYLHESKDKLRGKVTISAVSDEETFGPWGAQYLIENGADITGDCCICGEPGAPETYRFGERGLLWLKFTARTQGAHGAYVHMSESASLLCIKFINELEKALARVKINIPENVAKAIAESMETADIVHGKGGAETTGRVTLNIGTIQGGIKANIIPATCSFEADIRMPLGTTKNNITEAIAPVLKKFPQIEMEETGCSEPNWCDPYGEMTEYIRKNCRDLTGKTPVPIVSLGGTDMRFWRKQGVPAYIYGPKVRGMGSTNEHVLTEEYLHTVRMHTLCAYDFLKA